MCFNTAFGFYQVSCGTLSLNPCRAALGETPHLFQGCHRGIAWERGQECPVGPPQFDRFFRRLSGERGDVIVTLAGQSIRAVALGIVVTAAI